MDPSDYKEAKKENKIKSQRNKYDCKVGKGQAYNGKKKYLQKQIQIRFNSLKNNLRKTKRKKLYLYQKQTEF